MTSDIIILHKCVQKYIIWNMESYALKYKTKHCFEIGKI